jgi:hypothetical protein
MFIISIKITTARMVIKNNNSIYNNSEYNNNNSNKYFENVKNYQTRFTRYI